MNPTPVKETIGSLRDELYQLALALVRTPSVTGDEDTAQDELFGRLREWDLDVDLWTIESGITSHRAYCDDGLSGRAEESRGAMGPERRDRRADLERIYRRGSSRRARAMGRRSVRRMHPPGRAPQAPLAT